MAVTPLTPRINLSHLDYLSPRRVIDGKPVLVTHIYADAPSYKPVEAPGEGVACVDDVARAAIVYMDEHARTGDTRSLDQGRAALNFTMRMQKPDGTFYNFVTDDQGTINREGATSKPGVNWWALRGMWALARGYREFASIDAAYATELLGAYQKTERALVSTLGNSPAPTWLKQLPSDQASIAALALAEMQEARPNTTTQSALSQVADGVRSLRQQPGRDGVLGFAAHTLENPEQWHAWGAHQVEALARAGQLLHRSDLVSAAREANEGLMAWQLAAGRVQNLTPLPERNGQQAYGIATATRGSMALYKATGDERFAQMAGLSASWLFGNNMASTAMYDADTGRGYDGIEGPPRGVNFSSGAESTIEALMTLQAIAGNPVAERFATVRPGGPSKSWVSVPANELHTNSAGLTAKVGVPVSGDYLVLASELPGAGPLNYSIDGKQVAQSRGVAGTLPALNRTDGQPIHLDAGNHELSISTASKDSGGKAHLQGVVLHPTQATSTYIDATGQAIATSFDLATGRLTIT